ncbi:unnamed protein product [Parajaminaea phylloscopi]
MSSSRAIEMRTASSYEKARLAERQSEALVLTHSATLRRRHSAALALVRTRCSLREDDVQRFAARYVLPRTDHAHSGSDS